MNAPVATPPRFVRLNAADNVAVAVDPIEPGAVIHGATAKVRIPRGHKMALGALSDGQPIMKFGQIIGFAKGAIEPEIGRAHV